MEQKSVKLKTENNENIKEAKIWIFANIIKMYRLLASWRERKRERLKEKEERLWRGGQNYQTWEKILLDPTDQKKKNHQGMKQPYAHTFNNLEKLC